MLLTYAICKLLLCINFDFWQGRPGPNVYALKDQFLTVILSEIINNNVYICSLDGSTIIDILT